MPVITERKRKKKKRCCSKTKSQYLSHQRRFVSNSIVLKGLERTRFRSGKKKEKAGKETFPIEQPGDSCSRA